MVTDANGRELGRVADVVVGVGAGPPRARRLVVRRTHERREAPWDAVLDLEGRGVEVRTGTTLVPEAPLADDELLLRRDVLDVQVFDLGGRALSRVADVRLSRSDGGHAISEVELGASGVLRRLGLRRVAGRFNPTIVDWSDVHLLSGRGHGLMLGPIVGGIGRLESGAVADMIGRIPVARGARMIEALPVDRAADALGRAGPRLGGAIVAALAPERAGRIVGSMPSDDATAVLRHVTPDERRQVLDRVPSQRARILERLLERRPRTAGGLMNPEVLVLLPGEGAAELLARVGREPPALDALLTVFATDPAGRVVGAVQPRALLAGDVTPWPVPVLPVDTPLDRVIDCFAVNDVLALPVTDSDGRLLGAVAVDDVLEELLAERLPGARRRSPVRLGRRSR